MDDLVAALAILANKLHVDVNELAGNFVMYTRVTAVVTIIVCFISMYLTYKVLDYAYTKFVENGAFLGYMRAQLKLMRPDDPSRAGKEATIDAIEKDVTGAIKIAQTVLMVLIMGAFAFGALRQIPTLARPEGAALESVMETLKDATKVEIVQPETRSSRKLESQVATSDSEKGSD